MYFIVQMYIHILEEGLNPILIIILELQLFFETRVIDILHRQFQQIILSIFGHRDPQRFIQLVLYFH